MSQTTINHILEFFYILIGLQFLYTAYRALRATDKQKRIGTALFWTILAIFQMHLMVRSYYVWVH